MTDYDTLRIKIVANAGSALTTVGHFSDRLKDLEKTADRLDFSRLEQLQKILRDIASIDLTKVSGGLYSVAKSFEILAGSATKSSFVSTMEKIETTTSESVEKAASSLSKGKEKFRMTLDEMIKKVEQFNAAQKVNFQNTETPLADKFTAGVRSIEDYGRALKTIDPKPLTKSFVDFDTNVNKLKADLRDVHYGIERVEKLGAAMQEIGLNGTQMESVLSAINTETSKFTPKQLEQVERMLKKCGYSSKEVENAISQLGKTGDKSSKKMSNGLQKVAIKFKSLALYRIMRLALMKIQQEFTNAIQNLAQIDVGFNDSISQLSSSFKYLSDAIIGMLAPLLESITPLITALADGLAEISNEIGKVFAESAGKDQFAEATKGVEDYAESLKKAKNVSLGIDELNVVKEDDNKNNYQMVDVQGQTNGALSGLKDIAKYIKEIIEPIKNLIKTVLPSVVKLLKPIEKSLDNVFKILVPIIDEIVKLLENILPPIIDFIGEIINFVADLLPTLQPVIDALMTGIKPILETIFNLIKEIFGAAQPLFAQIIDFIAPVMTMIGGVITQIFNFIEPLVEMVAKILAPIITTIFEILGSILNVLTPIIEVLFNTLSPILDTIFSLVSSIFNAILPILNDVLTPMLSVISPILEMVASIFNFLKPIIEVITNIATAVVNYLSPAFKTLGDGFAGIKEKIQPLTEWLTNICNVWKNLFSAVSAAFKGDWDTALSSVKNAFAGVINSIIGGFESMLNSVINGINTLLKPLIWALNKVGVDFSGIPNVSFGRVSFAQGGFPEDGLFFANHNELVGQFSDGRTAVANNQQITEGIYQAVLQAMRESGGSGQVVVQIDGKEIARAVNKHNQSMGGGTNLFKGGVDYGY